MKRAHTGIADSVELAIISIAFDLIAITYCILAARYSLIKGSMSGKSKNLALGMYFSYV